MSTQITTSQVAVLTTPTLLVGPTDIPVQVTVVNNTATPAIVYIGTATVSTATGFGLPATVGASLTFATVGPVYAIAAATGQTLGILVEL